jgi:glycosyltransferase involved in cell wall biosynthesis
VRICLITSVYPLHPGDGEAAAGLFARDLALEMRRAGVDVTILTQRRPGTVRDDDGIEVVRFNWSGGGKRLSTLSLSRPVDLFHAFTVMAMGQLALVRLLRRRRFDGVLALWAVPAGVWAWIGNRFFGVPYFCWTLGSDIWVYGRKALFRPLLRRVLRAAARVYADGEELRAETERIGRRSCEFLPTTRMLPKENLPSVPLRPDKVNFLFIGRFHAHKGPDVLLDAIGLIPPARLEDLHFHILGDGEFRPILEDKLARGSYGQAVSLGGYIGAPEAAAYLAAAHALIIPSRVESIPVVLSDALQMGCPVVVTNVGDMGALVGRYGAGLVAPPNDPQALCDAILDMRTRSRAEFAPNIGELYKLFDMGAIAQTLLANFRR